MPTPLQPITSETELRARALRGLLRAPGDAVFDPRSGTALGRSDWDLNPEFAADLARMDPPRAAAVLVPVVLRDTLSVLFTQRTETLSTHAGQVSFPGGRIDPDDGGPVDAALREAEEEIGLDRGHVETVGFLDGYRTGTGYHVTPVVGLVRPNFSLKLHDGEVAEVFEVPLAFLMDPANHRQDSREWRGVRRQFWAMPYGDRYIWGATAGMLKNLHARLFTP